jgi:hypothetical protein
VATLRLPSSVQLPTGRVIGLSGSPGREATRKQSPALFADAIALVDSGAVVLRADGESIDIRALDLRDFHALRAILVHAGWLDEEPIEITCRNCERPIKHRPCASMKLGPFVDRELSHAELDATLDLEAAHPIPAVTMPGPPKRAKEIVLRHLRVADAMPLFEALGQRRLRVTSTVVHAMGIVRMGSEPSEQKLARALQRASDEAWSAVTELFLEAHYSPRLFSVASCPGCGARNDVDAPYEREFGYADHLHPKPGRTNDEVFPTFEAFADRAHALAETMFDERRIRGVSLVAEGGVPACDDGGEPLLGSYVPAFEGDASNPTRPAEVTVYYRTFRAMWDEDGPYDWDDELGETVEHELAHHEAHLAGDDPVDDEERLQIAEEAAGIVGRRALARGAVLGLFADLKGFARRTWPLWLLAIAGAIVAIMAGR